MQEVSEYTRFCPDNPSVIISDAVCAARRRSRFPQCPGCRFNEDETREVVTGVAISNRAVQIDKRHVIERVFVGHQVLAKYPEPLNEDVAWLIGHAAASYLRGSLRGLDRSDPNSSSVVLARDGRSSGESLSKALAEGIRSTGATVIDIAKVDLPQMVFAVNRLDACGGLMTTGSHAPADFNGFKIVGKAGRAVAPETGLADIARIAQNMVKHDTGMEGAMRSLDLSDEYRSSVRAYLHQVRPMKVVIDASNGMAGRWLPFLLGDIEGLDLIMINDDPEVSFAHDPDPLERENLIQLREKVLDTGADFGACLDSDASRIVFVDDNGDVVRSDLITALLVGPALERFPASTIVHDLRSSRVVIEEIRNSGGVPRRERVGQPFIQKAMAESKAAFGGGLGGRYFFRENHNCDSASLAMVQIMNLMSARGMELSRLVKPLLRYAHSGQRYSKVNDAQAIIRRISVEYVDARVDFLDGVTVRSKEWWFNLRQSATQLTPSLGLIVEADNEELMQQKLEQVTAQIMDCD